MTNKEHCSDGRIDEIPTGCAYQVTWLVSSIVMSLLKYVFCVVGAVIIHDVHPTFHSSLAVGVGVQCASTLVTCLITSYRSKLGINISGPDIIAALFASQWAKILTDSTVPVDQALPTLLFLIALSTFFMGLVWLLIGYTGATRIVDYMPAPVVSGFLGCIGYKVLKFAIKVSVGHEWYHPEHAQFWILFLPAIPIGIPLYYLKLKHIGNPMVILPAFLIVPTALFFIIVAANGTSISYLRAREFLFPDYQSVPFYSVWTELRWAKIAWRSIPACLPDMGIMIIILVIDSLLKLAATKSKLQIEIDMEDELRLAGWQNVVASLFVASPGYSQVKFNLLSYGILGNTKDRKVGVFVGLFNGAMWLSGFMLINYLPRFLLGGLLLYAACPFIVDNMFLTYAHMSKKEFAAIWVIVLTVFLADLAHVSAALLLAVVVGMLLACIIFMLQYAHVSIVRDVSTGVEFQSKRTRPVADDQLLMRAGERVALVEVEGFVFFASAVQVIETINQLLKDSAERPAVRRLRYLIIDFEHVRNIDVSGCRAFLEVRRVAQDASLHLLLTGLGDKLEHKMRNEGALGMGDDGYQVHEAVDMDRGMESVEELLLERAHTLRKNWVLYDSFRTLHLEANLKERYKMYEVVLASDIGSDLWKYATMVEKKKGEFICLEGQTSNEIYLLQRGRVSSFTATDEGQIKRLHSSIHGAVVNDECAFLNLPVSHSTIADEDCTLFVITRQRLRQMERLHPRLAVAVQRYILRHTSNIRHRLERNISSTEHDAQAAEVDDSPEVVLGGRFNSRRFSLGKKKKRKQLMPAPAMKAFEQQRRQRSMSAVDSPLRRRRAHSVSMRSHSLSPVMAFATRVISAHQEYANSGKRDTIGNEDEAKESGTLAAMACGHHSHHFQHLEDALQQLEQVEGAEDAIAGVQPHLSQREETQLLFWFSFFSTAAAFSDSLEAMRMHHNRQQALRALAETPRPTRFGPLDYNSVHKALMHLGLFVELKAVAEAHAAVTGGDNGNGGDGDSGAAAAADAGEAQQAQGQAQAQPRVTLSEFRSMVEHMTIMELTVPQTRHFVALFQKHAVQRQQAAAEAGRRSGSAAALRRGVGARAIPIPGADAAQTEGMAGAEEKAAAGAERGAEAEAATGGAADAENGEGVGESKRADIAVEEMVLSRGGLAALMVALGHPEDGVELDLIMNEWDPAGNGFLTLDAFVSIVAIMMKMEHMDVQLESDFCHMAGVDASAVSKTERRAARVTVNSYLAALRATNKPGIHPSREEVEEMVFDASSCPPTQEEPTVKLRDLINCLEMTQLEEVRVGSKQKAAKEWRQPSGRHLSIFVTDSGTPDDRGIEMIVE